LKYETQLDNEAESFVNVIKQAAWNNIPDGKTEYSLWSATAKLNNQWYNNHPLETPTTGLPQYRAYVNKMWV